MPQACETTLVSSTRVWCDGAGGIRAGAGFRSAALGHPRVYLEIDGKGYADCGYCDRRFILAGGPADLGANGGANGGTDPGSDGEGEREAGSDPAGRHPASQAA